MPKHKLDGIGAVGVRSNGTSMVIRFSCSLSLQVWYRPESNIAGEQRYVVIQGRGKGNRIEVPVAILTGGDPNKPVDLVYRICLVGTTEPLAEGRIPHQESAAEAQRIREEEISDRSYGGHIMDTY